MVYKQVPLEENVVVLRRRWLPPDFARYHTYSLRLPYLPQRPVNERAATAREMHTSAGPSLLSSPRLLTGIMPIPGLYGFEAAALLILRQLTPAKSILRSGRVRSSRYHCDSVFGLLQSEVVASVDSMLG